MADSSTDTTPAIDSTQEEVNNDDNKRKLEDESDVARESGQAEKKIKQEDSTAVVKPEDEKEKEGEEAKTGVEGNGEEFAYSKRGDFTSEVYKIIVKGLPKYFGIGEVRKHFEHLLNKRVCKVIPMNRDRKHHGNFSGVFVTFYDEETRQMAINTLNGYKYKGRKLYAEKAHALPDPYIMKCKVEKTAEEKEQDILECTEEKLKDTTVPLWKMSYEEQLESKMVDIKKQINQMAGNMERYQSSLKPWFKQQRAKFDGLPLELLPIRRCNQPEGYRNKCEFSIGVDPKTNEKTVGFRFGKYSDGSVYIGSVYNLPHIHDRMKQAVRVFESYIRASKLDIFDCVTQTGYWKLLMSRYSSSTDELMIKIGFDPQDLSDEDLNKVRAELKDYYENSEEGKDLRCTSVNFHLMPRRLAPGLPLPTVELLSGSPTISVKLFDLSFNISPVSFFQINTEACHTLYEAVAELAALDKDTTLLDICSGVGTIGLCLANRCAEVLGVESNGQAVADAKLNAERNNIDNATFFEGKAERITAALLNKANTSRIAAVLDPPRAGIHQKLATYLRSSSLDSIVYLACDTKAVMNNFNGLSFGQSKKFTGSPFVPVKVIPVDMFPYTPGVEWVILLQRFNTLQPADEEAPVPINPMEY